MCCCLCLSLYINVVITPFTCKIFVIFISRITKFINFNPKSIIIAIRALIFARRSTVLPSRPDSFSLLRLVVLATRRGLFSDLPSINFSSLPAIRARRDLIFTDPSHFTSVDRPRDSPLWYQPSLPTPDAHSGCPSLSFVASDALFRTPLTYSSPLPTLFPDAAYDFCTPALIPAVLFSVFCTPTLIPAVPFRFDSFSLL